MLRNAKANKILGLIKRTCKGLKDVNTLTITIDTAILIKDNKKLCFYIRAIFYINCDYNFNP